jgi:uncharacterized protein YggE
MNDVVISVRGEHEIRRTPEEAVAHLTIRTEGPERGAVVERISALTEPVRDDLIARKEAGGVVEWSSQRVSVWSDRPWNAEGKRLAPVHYASVEVTATFTDFAALSWWVGDVAEREGVQIGGIDWRLSPATRVQVERDAATEAVHVAVWRAEAYAAALGLGSVTALEVADIGLLSRESNDASQAPLFKGVRAAAFAADMGGGPALQFEPEDIVISSGVEARFVAR